MRASTARALPSVGIWLALLSWGCVAALLLWGAQEPRLDRMRRELDELATRESACASDWLTAELRIELQRRPRLAAKLAGETGARAREARRDGSTRSSRFHVVTTAEVTELSITGTARGELQLTRANVALTAAVAPGETARIPLPPEARGVPGLWTARRSGEAGELVIVGDLAGEAP